MLLLFTNVRFLSETDCVPGNIFVDQSEANKCPRKSSSEASSVRMVQLSYDNIASLMMALMTSWKKINKKSCHKLNFGAASFSYSCAFQIFSEKVRMVVIQFFVLLLTVLCESKISLVPQAILQLVRRNYGERAVVIEIFSNSKNVKILQETLKLLGSERKRTKLTLINIDKIDFSEFDDDDCLSVLNYFGRNDTVLYEAIFLFDTMKNYARIRVKFKCLQDHTTRPLNHLVYCEDADEKNIKQIITRDFYESFLLEQNDKVSLQTMTMFTEKQCRPEQLVEINQFSSLERKWKTEKFFRPIIRNFHGCELWLDVEDIFSDLEFPFLTMLKDEDGTETNVAEGAIVDMLDALSTNLNFTYIYNTESLDIPEYDFEFGIQTLMDYKSKSSYPIFSTLDVIVVPPGELYTSWEKLFLPFDWET